jgi:hypothetical protein
MKHITFSPADAGSSTLNMVADCSSEELTQLLRAACLHGATPSEQAELDDQIEALVAALVELRDRAGIELNARVVSEYGTPEGFGKLADDVRLSNLARQQCRAIYVRLVAQGVKAILGHG